MFGRARKPKPPAPAEELGEQDMGPQPTWLTEMTIADEDVPTVESPHVVSLRNSRGGPYYLAPDSAEPLPSGIWADLDPKAVSRESTRIGELLENGKFQLGDLDPDLRDFLLSDGPVGRKMIEILGGELEAPDGDYRIPEPQAD